MLLTISDFSNHIAIMINDKTTKLALIVLLVVFFDSDASNGSYYPPISVKT